MLPFSVPLILLSVLDGVLNTEDAHCKDKLGSESNNTHLIEKFTSLWPVGDWKNRGYFSDEYICDINVHWLSFGPPERASFIALAVIYMNIMLTGFIGNFLVLFLFARCKSLRSPGNTLIANLAASDGVITLNTPIFIYNCFYMGPALGDTACRIYGFLGGLSGTVSIVTLSAISFDRYFMIKFPLNRAYSNLRVKICLVIVWLYGLVFSVIPVLDLGLGKYTYEGYLTSCSFDYLTEDSSERIFIFAFFVAAWVVPFILITFCYVNIVKVVATRSIAGKAGKDCYRHVKEEESKKQEVKLALVVFGSICLWVVAWTPYSIVALLGIFGQKHLISPSTSMIPAVFCKIASCINPFMYALSHPKFKSELKNVMCGSAKKPLVLSKVWTTHSPKHTGSFGSCVEETSGIEEEMVELEVRVPPFERQISFETGSPVFTEKMSNRAKPSSMEMFCLPPNFSNKSSTFRKMSRRWSTKERQSKM